MVTEKRITSTCLFPLYSATPRPPKIEPARPGREPTHIDKQFPTLTSQQHPKNLFS